MWNKIKEFFKNPAQGVMLNILAEDAEKRKEERDKVDFTVSLMRHCLSTLNPGTMMEEDMTREQHQNLQAEASAIYNKKVLHDVKNRLLQGQLEFMGKEAKDMTDFVFARGTVNGLSLLVEELERLNNLYLTQEKESELFDKYKVFEE